ncbi:ribonuclease III [bacterium DOLZORAL124_38_8]|nr:MAG: ribonuclease III [bacterium DOLZORAL124_38_8]
MKDLFQTLGFEWKNEYEPVFCEAFTHRSAVNKTSEFTVHNERLEFLGDAVLELIVTELLFEKYPQKPEGELTVLRSALVKGVHLAEVAQRLNLGKFLILSSSERKSGGAKKGYLLANAVESLIGALYQTLGMPSARAFVRQWIWCDIEDIIKNASHIDIKTEFQEFAQVPPVSTTPRYEVIGSTGLDHEKMFHVAAFLGDLQVGTGRGKSKKEAQAQAAQMAMDTKSEWLKKF